MPARVGSWSMKSPIALSLRISSGTREAEKVSAPWPVLSSTRAHFMSFKQEENASRVQPALELYRWAITESKQGEIHVSDLDPEEGVKEPLD
jgi:hypothetical protein